MGHVELEHADPDDLELAGGGAGAEDLEAELNV